MTDTELITKLLRREVAGLQSAVKDSPSRSKYSLQNLLYSAQFLLANADLCFMYQRKDAIFYRNRSAQRQCPIRQNLQKQTGNHCRCDTGAIQLPVVFRFDSSEVWHLLCTGREPHQQILKGESLFDVLRCESHC